ncbi:hypothetical protein V5O48_001194 [Marasmius crinis-equi]|uniref:CP-type G domain-containing protein n=1 Tax=Marasmius crinis-equi TaxID=585013 RepID=A0ABR3FZ31_9AGAR
MLGNSSRVEWQAFDQAEQASNNQYLPSFHQYTTDEDSTSRLKSVTQERDLDEFLSTAQLAETDFTAERRNVKIIPQTTNTSQNPYLLSEQEEKKTLQKHQENKQRLRVPRRPPWTKSMTTAELERQEKAAFLDWRRGLAVLQEEERFLLTPFERNLEVWRQLWRVLERSHLVVQIVDARNPLRFRCEDLEDYVRDVEGPEGEKGTGKGLRRSLLLINKADLLTAKQRLQWADYFDSQSVQYAFFSAANASALQQARRDAFAAEALTEGIEATAADGDSDDDEDDAVPSADDDREEDGEIPDSELESDEETDDSDAFYSADEDEEDEGEEIQDPRIRVLSVLELEELFNKSAPDLSAFADANGNPPTKTVVGLVGYPNVGKSSTINALLGEKKVSVSSTPGKTKHFQTIHLSDSTILCDCPGLVFPQFATTKAELVCDGVLPIDQMKEYTGPISLVVQRIPKEVLEATYGLSIQVKGIEDGGDGLMKAENLLIAYAIARGYMRSGQGNPDEARAARYILKDYVNAKLLFCHSPPDVSQQVFNERTHQIQLRRMAGKKKAPTTRVGKDADTFVAPATEPGQASQQTQGAGTGVKSRALDQEFFNSNSMGVYAKGIHGGKGFSRSTAFPHQNTMTNEGVVIAPKHARMAAVLANQAQDGTGGKKHKKPKRVKQRSGKGYD